MALSKEAADFIKSFEGFTPTAKWDVNAYRIGHGSDTIELPNGTYRKVLATDTTTRELAAKDLARRINDEFVPRVRRQVGDEGWNKLPDASKVALLSLAYNYCSITKEAILNAAKEGNVTKLAKAIVDSTYNDNAKLSEDVRNALRNRRAKEADYALTDLGGNKKIVVVIGALLLLTAIVGIFIYRNNIISTIDKKI
jgi:GH24 family phage-related lysozyme (muramidase)